MLKALKRSLLWVTKRGGQLEAVADSEWRRRRLLILCYHCLSVDQEHLWRRPLFFTAREFEQRLRLLRRWGARVLPLGEAVNHLRAGTLPSRSVVLTFDDGTADFSSTAWPLLKQYDYPATVYATTYYSEKQRPVFPLICAYVLWKGRHKVLNAAPEIGITEAIALSDAAQRRMAARAIVDCADRDKLDADEKDRRAARLAELVGVDYGDLLRRRVLQAMTPEEIRRVAADGADVQLHTHRHRTPLSRDLFEQEIAENRTRLESWTGRRAEHFCYPSGVHHPEFLPWLAAQRVVTATTGVPGLAMAGSSPLLLPRIVDVAAMAPIELEGWLSGASQFLPRRRPA
jgi:peptidoglycan/xylan/chitin deacetylase (PgdA/CDA1 family)